jgi:hypothetical protein
MFALFGLLGRSREVQQLDHAVRATGLHPRLMPEAVKLTAIKLLKQAHGATLAPQAYEAAAALLSYCMLGAGVFADTNGAAAADAVEARIDAALQAGDSLDAQLVLLTLHAKVIEASVVDRYGLRAD